MSRKTSPRSSTLNALYTYFNVVCAMQIMSGTMPDTYISEHHYSAIGKHLETQHGNNRTKTDHLFKVLRKCDSKFDCLVYEMLYIKDIKPSLNTQADCIRAKLFTWHFRTFFCCVFLFFFLLLCFLPWELYPLDPQIFYVLFQILYIRFTPYTFSLFNLIMA